MGDISESAEDFLEACYALSMSAGDARPGDIAKQLGISMPSVTEMARKLESSGFINYEKYRPIELTESGKEIAKKVYERHIVLREFFIFLGVDEEIAETDACRSEHALSKTTIGKIKQFMRDRNGEVNP